MNDYTTTLDSGRMTVILHGGPAGLPQTLRTQQVSSTQDKVKILYQGGYEHFERRHGEFHWTMRTRIAE